MAGNQQARNNKAKQPKRRGKISRRGNSGMTSETMAPVKRTGTFRRRKFADFPPVFVTDPVSLRSPDPRVRCNLRLPRLDKWRSCGTRCFDVLRPRRPFVVTRVCSVSFYVLRSVLRLIYVWDKFNVTRVSCNFTVFARINLQRP